MKNQHSTVHDVTAYITQRGISNDWALQKILFYCQAWSLVWDGVPMFADDFQAWRDGPVVPAVWSSRQPGDSSRLSPKALATADAVVNLYGSKSSDWLVALTHREEPWIAARGGLPPRAHGSAVITKNSMASHYGGYRVAPKQFGADFKAALEILVDTPEEVLRAEITRHDPKRFVAWVKTGVGDPCAATQGS